MTYKNKKASFLFTLLFIAFLLSGCDKHRDERASLLRQKNSVEAELVSLKSQKAQISQSGAALTSGINNQTETLRERANRQVKLKDELAKFVLDHKLATLAVIAAGGGGRFK